ncbi:hypothetical protein NDU88_005048 [Pleurodeles waltl]|uniref:Uncharacterized protein n=1 Tax=Pleurodeles waltl TaxID=8319 RepID=A0AAV7UI26_PLEWA|nr:hypothetical protein NDU88_005048 [Pleurodeles waltl]
MGPASAGHRAELVVRADSSEQRTEELSRGHVGRRPVVFGWAAVRPRHAALSARWRWGLTTGADSGRDSPKYWCPSGGKEKAAGAECARAACRLTGGAGKGAGPGPRGSAAGPWCGCAAAGRGRRRGPEGDFPEN